jgi:hypothetical protein
MTNANRKRAIMAAQKVKQQATPQPLPADFTLPQLTREQRKAIYAPRAASSAPQHLQAPEWVRVWRTTTRLTYGLTALLAVMFGGVIAGESKKGIKP